MDKILQAFNSVPLMNLEIFAWTDSTITLAWIQALPSKWNTFVANRVSALQNLTPPSRSFHVSTKLNPSDIASRGALVIRVIHNSRWWNGPLFLTEFNKWLEKTVINEVSTEQQKVKSSVYSIIQASPQRIIHDSQSTDDYAIHKLMCCDSFASFTQGSRLNLVFHSKKPKLLNYNY